MLAAAGISVAVLAALFSACNTKDPFEGYRSSTLNFIADSDLARFDDSTTGYQDSGTWTWSWRGATDADSLTGFDYMTLTPAGTVGATAAAVALPTGELKAESPVFLLSQINLVNGGDFETGPVSADWKLGGTATLNIDASSGHIHGNSSLYMDLGNNDSVRYPLNTSTIADMSLSSSTHSYDLIFYISSPEFYYTSKITYNESINFDLLSLAPIQNKLNENFYIKGDFLSTDAMSDSALTFGYSAPSRLFIDDLRVLRSDIPDGGNRLRLLLKETDTVPSLLDGYYEFSLWVRKPAGRTFVTESDAKVPYASSFITLAMLPARVSSSISSGGGGAEAEFDLRGPPYDAGSGWTRIALRMNNGDMFSLDYTLTNPLIELRISPFDSQHPDVGEVEITQPELRYFLDAQGAGYDGNGW
jgi:hypothetical protein